MKGRAELQQIEGELDTLPGWIPSGETGLRKRILEAIAAGLDACILITEVPENCYAQEKVDILKQLAVRRLQYYQTITNQNSWDRFKEALADYLKCVTGALCASAKTLEDFQSIADLNGYKPGWAYFRHQQKKNYVRS